MVYIESEITRYVSEKAPAACQIWFVQDGHLIKTRYDQMVTGRSSKIETSNELLWRENAEKEFREAACKVTILLIFFVGCFDHGRIWLSFLEYIGFRSHAFRDFK